MPSVRSTFVNPLLTNIFIGYGGNQNYAASALFPTLQVDKETGLYFVRDKENLRAPADAHRGEFSRANRVTNTLTTAPYTLEEKSLEHAISERVLRNAMSPFDAKKNGTMLVADKLALDNEADAIATVLAAASGSNTLDTSNSWSTISTDIVGQIRTGRNAIQLATGFKANTAVLGKPSLDALMKNTAFLASIQYVSQVTEASLRGAIAAWFDVETVVIADAVSNTAKEGQTDSLSYLWGDVCVLAYVNRNAAIESTSFGYKLQQANMAYVDEWFEQEIKSTIVRASDFYDNKVVDSSAAYIITNTAT